MPIEHPDNHSILWQWRAYEHGSKLIMSSEHTFDSLTDCMADARAHGYGAEGA